MSNKRLHLLMRRGCHLCEQAANELRRLRAEFVEVDVDLHMDLQQVYGDAVPVLLDADGRELARAPLEAATLRRAVSQQRLG